MRPSRPISRLQTGLALAAVLLLIASLFFRPRPGGATQAADTAGVPRTDLPQTDSAPVRATSAAVSGSPPAAVSRNAAPRVTGVEDEAGVVRIQAGAVLATVNGTPLTLEDLLPLPADLRRSEQAMSTARYAFLLERAVDREIVFQQARAQGVELSEGQREQLARLRARSERAPAGVFDDLQHSPANAEFEARDAAAVVLQAKLAEAAGVPPREVTPAQVEQYYREHPTEFAALPSDPGSRQTAWETIDRDIRVKLARENFRRHEEEFEKFVERTRASAQIVRNALAP